MFQLNCSSHNSHLDVKYENAPAWSFMEIKVNNYDIWEDGDAAREKFIGQHHIYHYAHYCIGLCLVIVS